MNVERRAHFTYFAPVEVISMEVALVELLINTVGIVLVDNKKLYFHSRLCSLAMVESNQRCPVGKDLLVVNFDEVRF